MYINEKRRFAEKPKKSKRLIIINLKIMKNLKLIVFNLMSVIMLTIFLTSCEKQTIRNSATNEIAETESPASKLSVIEIEAIKNGSVKIFLPEEIALDNDKITEYLHSLSANELYQHTLTHKIVHFFGSTNNFEKFYQENPNYTFLTMDDVYKYAPNNIGEFQDFDPYNSNNITLRGCSIVASDCLGSTLIETEKCCSGFWPFKSCTYEISYTNNSSECFNPCSGVTCSSNQYCSNGNCYDKPTCPPCSGNNGECCPGETCIGTTCTPI